MDEVVVGVFLTTGCHLRCELLARSIDLRNTTHISINSRRPLCVNFVNFIRYPCKREATSNAVQYSNGNIRTKITFYETYVLKKIQDEGADADPEKYENEIEMENFAPSEAYDSPNLSYYVHV